MTFTGEAGQPTLIAWLLISFFGCNQGPESWRAFVYPDGSNLLVYETYGLYTSEETCVEVAVARLGELGAVSTGDFECGRDCTLLTGETTWICEE